MRNLIKITKRMLEKEVKIVINKLEGSNFNLQVYDDFLLTMWVIEILKLCM